VDLAIQACVPLGEEKKTSLVAGLSLSVGEMWLQLFVALCGFVYFIWGLFLVFPLNSRSEFTDSTADLSSDLAQAARTKDEQDDDQDDDPFPSAG